MPSKPPLSDKSDSPMCGIAASFLALSLEHHDNSKPVHHHGTPSLSWLNELYRPESLSESRYSNSSYTRMQNIRCNRLLRDVIVDTI